MLFTAGMARRGELVSLPGPWGCLGVEGVGRGELPTVPFPGLPSQVSARPAGLEVGVSLVPRKHELKAGSCCSENTV